MTSHVRRILVVELLGGFGDVLLALPAVHALAGSHPEASVDVLTFTPGDELLRGDPLVGEVLATGDHTDGAPRRAVAELLDHQPYDLVVTTTTYDGIGELCRAAAPRAVVDLWRRPPPDERVDRRYLRILAEEGAIDASFADLPLSVELADDERRSARAGLRELIGPHRSPVVLVPGSGMRVKQWPAPRWAAVASAARQAGRPVLAIGDARVPGVRSVPPSSLRELAALLAAVGEAGGVVVGGDTGPVRLATAVGTRAVSLFGPTLATRYGPDPASSIWLQGLPGCEIRRPTAITEQQCWWSSRCPYTDGDPACMADISAADVVGSLEL